MSILYRLPDAADWYINALRLAEKVGQAGHSVLDGPDTTDAGESGVAVGVGANVGDFTVPRGDITSSGGQRFTLACIAWVRTGEAVLATIRRRCAEIVRDAEEVLAADRTMGGVVSSAYVTNGSFNQKIDASGVIVTIEFRIVAHLF